MPSAVLLVVSPMVLLVAVLAGPQALGLNLLVPDFKCSSAMAAEPSQKTDRLVTARRQYDAGQYKDAAENLRVIIYEGKGSALVWLLLGQSYCKLGQVAAACQTLSCVLQYFPNSPEAAQAAAVIKSLPAPAAGASAGKPGNLAVQNNPFAGSSPVSSSGASAKTAGSAPATIAAPVAAPPGTTAPAPGSKETRHGLMDRIFVVNARFGHPPVGAGTVALVRNVIDTLPEPIYKILDRGSVYILVTPNLIDRFPDAVNERHPVFGTLLSAEYGRTFERWVYICEHLGADGGTDLQPQLGPEVIKGTAYTMLGHALDSCLERPSKDEQFMQLYKQDLASADLSGVEQTQYRVYLNGDQVAAAEVFAALSSSLMGNDTALVHKLDHTFPRCRAWIQSRIDAISSKNGR
jgi:hypothetical protein